MVCRIAASSGFRYQTKRGVVARAAACAHLIQRHLPGGCCFGVLLVVQGHPGGGVELQLVVALDERVSGGDLRSAVLLKIPATSL